MSTWAGAIVQTNGRPDLAAVFGKHRIDVAGPVTPWVLVQGDVALGSLRPPAFAEALSRDLQGTVLAFFVQTAASVEQIEHWERGRLVRRLEYSGDEDAWITQEGSPQAWEPTCFFADDEGTGEGEHWPSNLDDDLAEEDRVRYERARAARDATGVMDLLRGGSVWPLRRVCAHFGVDPDKPAARYTPPTNWKPRLAVVAILAFFLFMFLLGALTRP